MNDEDHILLLDHDEKIKRIISEVSDCKKEMLLMMDVKRARIDKLHSRIDFIESRVFKFVLIFALVASISTLALDHVIENLLLK